MQQHFLWFGRVKLVKLVKLVELVKLIDGVEFSFATAGRRLWYYFNVRCVTD